jgi:hypothetical protein
MNKNIWLHPFASHAIKRNLRKINRKPGAFASGPNSQAMGQWYNAANSLPTVDPWIRLLEDPALNEALDRLIVCNRIA